MKKFIVLTGASGNMVLETFLQLMQSESVGVVRALMVNNRKERSLARKWKK